VAVERIISIVDNFTIDEITAVIGALMYSKESYAPKESHDSVLSKFRNELRKRQKEESLRLAVQEFLEIAELEESAAELRKFIGH